MSDALTSASDTAAAQALRRAKALALGLLGLAGVVFIATSFAPPLLWVQALNAVAEASMVGALADWFAVRALFHRVPLPFIGRHTAIIPRNKDRIGRNLAQFVRERFLDPDSLVRVIRAHDPAALLARWLSRPRNARMVASQVARMLSGALETLGDDEVERFAQRALRSVVGQMDLSRALSELLAALTEGGRHQQLLDQALTRLKAVLQEEGTREMIATTLVGWLKREHPRTEKLLPSGWLGDKGSSMVAQALDSLLADMAAEPEHRLRLQFDEAVAEWIERLRSDPAWQARADDLRHYLTNDPALAAYLRSLWRSARGALLRDLNQETSAVRARVRRMALWLGHALAGDERLRASLDARLEQWAYALAPEVSQFLAQHIEETVRSWDAREMANLIELHIGRDLQFIRINGTLVGGLVGLVLFGMSHAGELTALVRALGR